MTLKHRIGGRPMAAYLATYPSVNVGAVWRDRSIDPAVLFVRVRGNKLDGDGRRWNGSFIAYDVRVLAITEVGSI